MKHTLALLLGLGVVSGASCKAHEHSPRSDMVTIDLTGLR